jgi:eukaryotic-like serine/threonine-protein kinase
MPIPDQPKPSDEIASLPQGAGAPVPGDGAGVSRSDGSPTVQRRPGSSSQNRSSNAPVAPQTPGVLPLPGEMLDGFMIEEVIGVGGMGAVYRALDTKLDRHVALKLLPPDQGTDQEVVARFYQEGRSAARLDHENIARVYSIGQHGSFHFIAFEFIEGETVRARTESAGALPVSEAVHIALEIAQALVHASERGVVHRDIKPSNIIITSSGRAKLVDMGLARRFERGGDNGLTQSGMTLGTFDYISPEQARDPRDVDVRSDLYSLGCTLFQMLTGRPPFPGGTVLQKLIQHQEEPPPDVRTLNPQVPAELAGTIARLMAKDRDRRYQTPEHLVRDLLGIAGSLGLTPPSFSFPGWHAEGTRHAWERSLVWLVPVATLVATVLGLAWWGRDLARTSSRPQRQADAGAPRRSSDMANDPGSSLPGSSPGMSERPASNEVASSAPVYSRNIPVSSNEDLLEILATAPRRSVIVLSDDGPYQIGGRAWSFRTPAPLSNADLTIKAEAGVRPVLKFTSQARLADSPPAYLLRFVGGHVTIEGVAFDLDVVLPDEPVAAIGADSTELTLRGCSFRRTNSQEGRNVAAISIRQMQPPASAVDRPPAVSVDMCHFDGGQTAILATGPADLALRDCTMGPGQPSIWLNNPGSSSPVFAELRLSHSSIMTGSDPVFRFDGTQVRVWVDDCVVAPVGRSNTTLVMIDNPRHLNWRGRSNLYSRIEVFQACSAGADRQEPIVDFSRWIETHADRRESGSRMVSASIWDAADPSAALATESDNPTRAFQLDQVLAQGSDAGAHHGPFGSILRTASVAITPRVSGEEAQPGISRRTEEIALDRNRSDPAGANAEAPQTPAPMPLAAVNNPALGAFEDDPLDLPPPMPPVSQTASTAAEGSSSGAEIASSASGQPRRDEADRSTRGASGPLQVQRDRRPTVAEQGIVRSSEQLLAQLNRLGNPGGVVRIAADAVLDLPTIVLEGTGRFQLLAEPGTKRPLVRFRPAQSVQRSPVDWMVMVDLRAGMLHLEGIDVLVPDIENLRTDRVAAIGVLPGAELTMTNCTVTVAVNRPGADLVVVQPEVVTATNPATGGTSGQSAVIHLTNCFLRSGGEGVAVAAGRRIDLELSNVLAATEGSLLHAFGGARPGRADSPAVKFHLNQVTARIKGGLVHLDSTPEEPELPFTSILAENTILTTANHDDPLFRLDGRDEFDELSNKIQWEGRKVAYDRIKTYRRDEIATIGAIPRIYNRTDWTSAFLPKDDSPMLGDVTFLREIDPTQATSKLERDDLRLSPQSPLGDIGPDVSRIPQPPAAGSL